MTKKTPKQAPTMTREEWLRKAAAELTDTVFHGKLEGKEMPAFHVSCGFPFGSRKAIGQAWNTRSSDDGLAHVFINPIIADSSRALDILAHEMIHVADDNKSGHKGYFRKVAKAIGLEGKMTATVASEELKKELASIVEVLGEYPHAAITPSSSKKQSTRMIKAECFETGYTTRLSRKWIDDLGAPICPCCNERMNVFY